MRRRYLITAAGAAAAGLLAPATASAAAPVSANRLQQLTAAAWADLDASRLDKLTGAMPGLLETAKASMDAVSTAEWEAAAGAYARLLAVWGHVSYRTSNENAALDAARTAQGIAAAAGDPVAAAEADRVAAVVARRTGDASATTLMVDAADRLERATALASDEQAAVWAETLCSAAYTAAGFGAFDDADALLAAAGTRAGDTGAFTATDVAVFATSAAMNAGDWNLVLGRADYVDPARITTRHQGAHFHKSLAIAAAACGDATRAVAALEVIDRTAPEFLAHRPWTTDLAADLIRTRVGAASPVVRSLVR